MNEVDKRIAEEVMGEPEPPKPDPEIEARLTDAWPTEPPHYSGVWRYQWNIVEGVWEWRAPNFSSDLDQALRAVDRYFEANQGSSHNKRIGMWYWPARGELVQCSASFNGTACYGYGQTLPEAICNLLLALVEDD